MTKIKDCQYYSNELRKSLEDKLFFEKLAEEGKIDSVVDFGCADGSLLRQVKMDYPNLRLLGIDENPNMMRRAMVNCPSAGFFLGGCLPLTLKKEDLSRTCLVLSSVIHELYSYKKPEEVKEFWDSVFSMGFGYIAIRDMMTDRTSAIMPPYPDELEKSKEDPKYDEFVSVWGEVKSQKDLVHFLLKSQYENSPNWARELRENYLPITFEELVQLIPQDKYFTKGEHYVYYYTENVIKNKFGIKLSTHTHVKLILERK